MSRTIKVSALLFVLLTVCQGFSFAQIKKINPALTNALRLPSPVVVYSGANYQGQRQEFTTIGTHSLNFNVKSITVPEGYYIDIASDAECLGRDADGIFKNIPGSANNILGSPHCGIRIKRIKTSDAKLRVFIRTGNDDLRQNSNASLRVTQQGRSAYSLGLTRNGGIPKHTPRTFEPLLGNVLPSQITGLSLAFSSGSTGPFDATDKWDVEQIDVFYVCNDGVAFYLGGGRGNPWIRFNGTSQYAIPMR